MSRELSYAQAICEATDQCMAQDERVYVMGLGATDPKAIFGTTAGLEAKYGDRVLDMPTAENGMTGIGIGSALVGRRPVMVHQRVDFAILALDQIFNSAAKWHYMFGGRRSVPIVIRLIIGRGWGQGPQHSQSLQALFAHFPGLKVVMPVTPHDAKGLLISAIEDPNPVIFLEHRWLHNVFGAVPEEMFRVPIGVADVVREGKDISIVATSQFVLESIRAAKFLADDGIDAEVVDVRSLRPLDKATILASVRKTGRALAVDAGWKTLGFAGELIAIIAEEAYAALRCAPRRITAPDTYVATSPALANRFYPSSLTIVNEVRAMLGRAPVTERDLGLPVDRPKDVPDITFSGPF